MGPRAGPLRSSGLGGDRPAGPRRKPRCLVRCGIAAPRTCAWSPHLVATLAVGWWLTRAVSTGERVAVAAVLGGALGNLVDRLANGAVTDWVAGQLVPVDVQPDRCRHQGRGRGRARAAARYNSAMRRPRKSGKPDCRLRFRGPRPRRSQRHEAEEFRSTHLKKLRSTGSNWAACRVSELRRDRRATLRRIWRTR